MAKFKVGDKVKIVDNYEEINTYGISTESIRGWINITGNSFVIEEVDELERVWYKLNSGDGFYWVEDMLEPLQEIKCKKENISYMKILKLYREKKLREIQDTASKEAQEIEQLDSIQSLINDTQDQLNALLGRENYDRVYITVNNLHGQNLHDDITEQKIEILDEKTHKAIFEINSLIEEVSAMLELTSDYDEQIKILKKYKILNKDGMLNV